MNATMLCPKCGTKLNAEGLCPACLLTAGMATRTVESVSGAGAAPPAARPEIGAMFGSYRIARLLGRGGMGEVYEAEQTETGRRVAIKVLNQAITSEADRKRFIREGRMAATVSDPHVVYVYGSEEIGGAPVISMELADGGSLKDRVKKDKPLSPSEAVDDILQVIDGLDAAQAAGVLHRDIKPANCFVDRDGTVKVGDFGLSISTLGHMESQNLTAPGSLLGTPAFASPEQLRGSQLDVRADIYSVGATLYFLLTGKPPHEADSIVALITAVLDKVPASPKSLQPKIPQGLANAVMKCLAKDPKDRFANYAELRNALQPFSSVAPTPGTLGLRFVAGLIDTFITSVPSIAFATVVGFDSAPINLFVQNPSLTSCLQWAAFAMFELLYFGIPEGLWGASLGKFICRLRIVGPDRNVPGIPRALLRSLVFNFLYGWAPYAIELAWRVRGPESDSPLSFGDAASMVVWALIFATARRSNGFAAIHDLLSGTRVIAIRVRQTRPALHGVTASLPSRDGGMPSLHAARLGPYSVLETLAKNSGSEVLLGCDEVLRRNVWIAKYDGATPPLAPSRRDLARPGRVRWLNGARTAIESWDAFEAPDGKPLTALVGGRQAWSAVRFWLLDLAGEISAGMKDGSLPPLAIENVFVTAQGRAMLLDLPLRGSGADVTAPSSPTLPDVQKFLGEVANVTLGANPRGLPVEVPPFLKNLRERSLHAMEFVVANLKSFTEKIPAVSRGRRAACLFLAPACYAAVSIFIMIGMGVQKRAQDRLPGMHDPKITEFRQMLAAYGNLQGTTNGEEVAQGVRIAAKFGDQIRDPAFWRTYGETMNLAGDNARKLAEQAVARYSHPTAEHKKISESMSLFTVSGLEAFEDKLYSLFGLFAFLGLMFFAAIFNLIMCVVGIPVGLRIFGIAIVDKNGRAAPRWRLLVRWLAIWILPVAYWFSLQISMFALHHHASQAELAVTLVVVALTWLAGLVVAIANPARGLHDRLAGTWLVPR
jgi:serine/threonine protein kinase